MTNRKAGILAVAMACAAVAGFADAASALERPLEAAMLRTYLGCTVMNEKVLVITNTSGAAIVGKAITYDAERKPDHLHYGRTLTVGTLAAGGILQLGTQPTFSCVAWTKGARSSWTSPWLSM